MIRTLLFSTLYPNEVAPGHGIFVETRLRQLLAGGDVETRVVAPVPWFPWRHPIFGDYAMKASVPAREVRHGIQVDHPRYLVPPKIGMNIAPFTLARAGLSAARELIESGFDFDIIDAHYFYPDGVAATMMGRALKKPVVITARGTDVNLLPRYRGPRRMIRDAARSCMAVVAVSSALKDAIIRLGVGPERVTVLRNGVDVTLFYPEDRASARESVGASAYSLASVGNLIPTKGHHLVIRSLAQMGDVELFIAGRGACEANLRTLASKLGVYDRVHFLGVLPQSKLRTLYSAADCLVLASEREGWPNVVLEAMACGAPVVATNVGGVPEILTMRNVGLLMERLSADAIVRAVKELRANAPNRAEVCQHARTYSWDETTSGQVALFRAGLERSKGNAACVTTS